MESLFKLSLVMALTDNLSAPMNKVKKTLNENMRETQQLNMQMKKYVTIGSAMVIAGITAKATKFMIEEMTSVFATGYEISKAFYSNLSDV